MYRWIFMAKNCVVSIRPVSPYHEPMPQSSGSGLNAPGGCLSKPTTSATSACAGDEHGVRGGQRRAAGGAAVLDVDERQAGEPEAGDRGVGVAAGVRSAGGEVDLLPADARVGERTASGDRRHLQAGDALVAAERMDADADDGDVLGHRSASSSSSAGRNAKVTVPESPGAAIRVSSIGIPMRSRAGSASVRRASTRTSPGSST